MRSKPSEGAETVLLRSAALCPRLFWRSTLDEQLRLFTLDKDFGNFKRPLLKNEMMTMALNEVAAHHGRGFFFFMLDRDGFQRWSDVGEFPKSRQPPKPRFVPSSG